MKDQRIVLASAGAGARNSLAGFTLLELVFVCVILVLMAAMAVPLVNRAVGYFKLRGAVAEVTGAIQSTRYQAIFQGCPHQVVFTAASRSYQVQRQCPIGGAFANYCVSGAASCPVPLSGGSPSLTLNADITLAFSPGGKVTSPAFPAGGINMVVTYDGKPPETISVSSYGNINVNP
jgi:type II secretory pathway pseudopilin PulG